MGMKKNSRHSSTPSRQHAALTGALSQLGAKTPIPASPGDARIESFPNPSRKRPYTIRFECPEFTSICPVTGQPDFGRITVEYVPGTLCIESKSLKLYLGSFRNQGAFAERIANRILDDLVAAVRPKRMTVTADFTARGGISIHVVAAHTA
jgi:7-cyano-7-deazaguanine reductase